jgi:hypothetical protein
MKSADRMFRVLVLGGIALTACGGMTTTHSDATDSGGSDSGDSGSGSSSGSFPQEGPPCNPGCGTQEASVPVEAGHEAGPDAFPMEGPAPLDSGSTDVNPDVQCFPAETALADAGCIIPQGD